MCFGVVEKQGHALLMTIGAIRLDLLPLRAPIPDFVRGYGAVELNRFVRSRQRVEDAFDMRFPNAEIEIEIMLSIAAGNVRFRLRRFLRSARLRQAR